MQQVLGKALDKAQQLSTWDRRPLSGGSRFMQVRTPSPPCPPPWRLRLTHAPPAADAYRLLEVYQALCREPPASTRLRTWPGA